jgi:hypothetical protein
MPSLATQLAARLAEIKEATGPTWRKTCLEKLQEVTGLTLSTHSSGYEVGYPCYCGHPAEFSLPSRNWAETAANPASVMEWCEKLPACGHEEPEQGRVIDPLGAYYCADRVMGARVELYWGRILAAHLDSKERKEKGNGNEWPLKALAKVVMLHELAHYVTHEGSCDGRVCDGCGLRKGGEKCALAGKGIIDGCNGRHWADFPKASKFTVEVLAQMATEDALDKMGSAEQKTKAVFIELRDQQTELYRANASIRDKLEPSALQPPCGRNPPRKWNDGREIFWYQISGLGGLAGAADNQSSAALSRATDEVGFLEAFRELWKVKSAQRQNTCITGVDLDNL